MLGVKRNTVRLETYDERYPAFFASAKIELQQILGDNILNMQHIGSTAIVGIVAKPVLDIAVIVRDLDLIDTDGMARFGYIHRGEAGVSGRCLYVKYRDRDISTHHIHCYQPYNPNFLANLTFRDFLNTHPDYALQYNDLKLQLADKYFDDRAKYTSEKTGFIKMILAMAHSPVNFEQSE